MRLRTAALIFLAVSSVAVWAAPQAKSAPAATPATAATPAAAATDQKAAPNVDKDTYKIGPGDALFISVWKEPDLTRSTPIPVRPDGKITMPLIGDIQASGLTPHQLESSLTKQLSSFVSNPSVSVSVQEVHSQKFNIVGEVQRPGAYELNGPPSTVLDAIALAGGLKDFAKGKKIYILRVKEDGSQVKLPFNYKEVIKGQNMAQNVVLQPRDTIVVP